MNSSEILDCIKSLKSGDMVALEWEDSTGYNSWYSLKDIAEILIKKNQYPIKSVAYFVFYDDRFIAIAMSHDLEPNCNEWGLWKTIPISQIINIRIVV